MEKKRRTGTSSPPKVGDNKDLVARRKKLLEAYFENGRQIAGELVQEIEAARRRLQELESDNAQLRMQLRSDTAIRDLLQKIDHLEAERKNLSARVEDAEHLARNELAHAVGRKSLVRWSEELWWGWGIR
ncbi:MAG: hypothetical protein WCJ30_24625 [Deltaproteobacteria bacterium]